MAEGRRSRGFTRIDALVAGIVCLVLVVLVAIVPAMTQEHYFRTVCGANLAQVGKTMIEWQALLTSPRQNLMEMGCSAGQIMVE